MGWPADDPEGYEDIMVSAADDWLKSMWRMGYNEAVGETTSDSVINLLLYLILDHERELFQKIVDHVPGFLLESYEADYLQGKLGSPEQLEDIRD